MARNRALALRPRHPVPRGQLPASEARLPRRARIRIAGVAAPFPVGQPGSPVATARPREADGLDTRARWRRELVLLVARAQRPPAMRGSRPQAYNHECRVGASRLHSCGGPAADEPNTGGIERLPAGRSTRRWSWSASSSGITGIFRTPALSGDERAHDARLLRGLGAGRSLVSLDGRARTPRSAAPAPRRRVLPLGRGQLLTPMLAFVPQAGAQAVPAKARARRASRSSISAGDT
mgnify:CR=1 FL=1